MIRNYLKIAIRQLRKQKLYAAIKIGGFALGIAACLLIALYIREETSYDKSYPDANRIYRVVGYFNDNGKVNKGTDWPAPMAKAIKADLPEVENAGRLMPNSLMGAGNNELKRADQAQNTFEDGFTFADQEMLNILKLPMVYGKREDALKDPLSMVISKSKADKYFLGQDPVGKIMYINNDKTRPFKIGGVMQDIPETSHLHKFNFLVTMAGQEFGTGEQNNWGNYNYPIYLSMRPGTKIAQFENKLTTDLVKNYFLPQLNKDGVKDAEKLAAKLSIHLQPVSDINLYSYDIDDNEIPHSDIRFIWLFGAIASFILVIACINFVNLSTAKSANRAKEVGLRKVVGSYRSHLINQFLTESIIYSVISFILGILVAWLLLPYFNTLASKTLIMPWHEWLFIPIILISAVIVGVIAGLYPAFYLSGFKPIQVLKSSISTGSKSPLLRNSLVVFQFTASIILIISTIVIYNETHLILNRKVGFDKDQVMILQGANTLGDDNVKILKTELSKIASVKSVSISDYLPVNGTKRNGNTFFNEGRTKIDAGVGGQFWQIDDTYLKTLGMKLVAGRNFSYATIATDERGLIINQTMAKKLNLKDPIGKRITNGGIFTVIGVVKDFNFESMRSDVQPLALHFGLSPSMVSVKISGSDVQNTIANISAVWRKYSPDQPIRYTFLDEQFAVMYADVQRTGHIFTSFAVLAIIIACLGLFALSAFMAEQRSKEIGIRKVLGATVSSITTLLSMDFVKLVLIAILIASPIAWYGMNKWLQDFAYKVPISWWIFVLSGLAAIVIALLTVSFQSIKAALMNPVKRLKSE
ncbi:MAG: FtsX-like permease family protein [Mucilaginibacter sp.]|nr:FtsX-like permease family protein [Mucilaginibacter sp.]